LNSTDIIHFTTRWQKDGTGKGSLIKFPGTATVYTVRALSAFSLHCFWGFGGLDSEPTVTVQLADLKSNCCEKPQWGLATHTFRGCF